MRDDNGYYYLVSLGLPGNWKNSQFTYNYEFPIEMGEIVKVPFGNTTKIGFVVAATDEPEHSTKPIIEVFDIKLNKKSLSLHQWINNYYPSPPGSITRLIAPSYIDNRQNIIEPVSNSVLKSDFSLNKHQQKAFDEIINTDKPSVLYGITGSGKTRIYAKLAIETMNEGRNVLILYPEISLSSQTHSELSKYIPSDAINMHHSKSGRKTLNYNYFKSNQHTGNLFIGARSALFLPYNNLGLVIIDEAHDSSYKQDSGVRYNGIHVAGALAKIHKAKLLLGSATPPIAETKQIIDKGGQLIKLDKLAINDDTKKTIKIVDMKDKKNKSEVSIISKTLLEQLVKSKNSNKQSLLFINRRGTSRLIQCSNCSWNAICKECELPLTYHHDKHKLICHVCGTQSKTMSVCPKCKSRLSQKTPGIKAIESELNTKFPEAKIARFDSDNLIGESLNKKYEEIKSGKYDIIIGTQIITKGLDLPHLETVGILNADGLFSLPDYTSNERAFQQLVQVSGRVGRGHTNGIVIVQTNQPENYLYNYVSNSDWLSFYKNEIAIREKSKYPPFVHTMRIISKGKNSSKTKQQLLKLNNLFVRFNSIELLGPAPRFYEKVGQYYYWQIIAKSKSRKLLVSVAEEIYGMQNVVIDLDPVSFL